MFYSYLCTIHWKIIIIIIRVYYLYVNATHNHHNSQKQKSWHLYSIRCRVQNGNVRENSMNFLCVEKKGKVVNKQVFMNACICKKNFIQWRQWMKRFCLCACVCVDIAKTWFIECIRCMDSALKCYFVDYFILVNLF